MWLNGQSVEYLAGINITLCPFEYLQRALREGSYDGSVAKYQVLHPLSLKRSVVQLFDVSRPHG
eukprot:scaffold197053_cov47-Prasinocladus_malaysianus.AAC.1